MSMADHADWKENLQGDLKDIGVTDIKMNGRQSISIPHLSGSENRAQDYMELDHDIFLNKWIEIIIIKKDTHKHPECFAVQRKFFQ